MMWIVGGMAVWGILMALMAYRIGHADGVEEANAKVTAAVEWAERALGDDEWQGVRRFNANLIARNGG